MNIVFNISLVLFLLCSVIGLIKSNLTFKLSLFGIAFASLCSLIFVFDSYQTLDTSIYVYNIASLIPLEFCLNRLSTFFFIIVSLAAFINAIYSIGYLKSLENRSFAVFLYGIFVASMLLVLVSNNIFAFLIFWELMSVTSYFLVTIEGDDESSKAGLLYIVMTHIGTTFIIGSFFLFYKYTGDLAFSNWFVNLSLIPEKIKLIIFLSAFIGFGFKAGIVPFHSWLPFAHPQAPSNVSALMSGVMIKLGIFGILKFAFPLFDKPPLFLGALVLFLGSLSALVGIFYALVEKDVKRLLAYSSIENVGIILLGLGSSLIFKFFDFSTLSYFAMIAGMLHLFNHSIFKSLLFMTAGSLIHQVHTKNIEEMGGLAKIMPKTAIFFLVGIVSICAFPPFNGFMSEWLTYQSLLNGFSIPSVSVKIFLPISAIALVLTGAMASVTFAKFFGIAFLGVSRSNHHIKVNEKDVFMNIAMFTLSILCIFFGLLPQFILFFMPQSTDSMANITPLNINFFRLQYPQGSSVMPLMIFTLAIAVILFITIFSRLYGKSSKITYADSWDCGMKQLTERMQYTAEAFTKPLRIIFKKLYQPRREVEIEYLLKPLLVKNIRYESSIEPFFEKYIFLPFLKKGKNYILKLRIIQSGSLHLYLAYILITLVLLLTFGL